MRPSLGIPVKPCSERAGTLGSIRNGYEESELRRILANDIDI